MAENMSKEDVAEAMYKMVKDSQHVKQLKPMDLIKAMVHMYEDRGVDKKLCKLAIKDLINSGRCVYTYFGGSYIEMPHEEGAANK